MVFSFLGGGGGELCEAVANFWQSSNVPRPLFQNQSDMFKTFLTM